MLYFTKQIGSTLLGLWKIEESKDDFLAMLHHREWLEDILTVKVEKRLVEKLAVRVLLKELSGEEKQILYRPWGCPYLPDDSFYLSVSHTDGYAAVALNPYNPVGIDVEYYSQRVHKVRSRLVREDEYINPVQETAHLLLHFSAKESMFKMLGYEGVDFLRHLHIKPFEVDKEGFFRMTESKTAKQQELDVYYRVEQDFVLTCLTGTE